MVSRICTSIKSPNTPLTCTLIVSVPSVIPSSTAEKILAATLLLTVKLPVNAWAISPELIPLTANGTVVPSATFVVVRVITTL